MLLRMLAATSFLFGTGPAPKALDEACARGSWTSCNDLGLLYARGRPITSEPAPAKVRARGLPAVGVR